MEIAIIAFAVNRSATKGLVIGITLVVISHSTGHYMLTTYAVMIFKIADSPLLTPYMASILLAVALIFGSLLTTTLADILGRKSMVIKWINWIKLNGNKILKLLDFNIIDWFGHWTFCHGNLWLSQTERLQSIIICICTRGVVVLRNLHFIGWHNSLYYSCQVNSCLVKENWKLFPVLFEI